MSPGSRLWALRLVRLIAAIVLILNSTGLVADEPLVRIEVSPTTLDLGKSARLQVTVLVPTWQPEPPVYPSFEVPNAITRLPADSTYPTSERIGRETWSGIVRNYRVTPLLAADFTLGGGSIRITWADPGKTNRVIDEPVPTVSLSVRVPAGAADLSPYLAGSDFRFERTITGADEPLAVGDALVIQYQARLDGMPALFIPPLAPVLNSPLATTYPEEPNLLDNADGAGAGRQETVNLVLNHGGRLELPGQTFLWWNTTTEQIEEARIAPVYFDVQGLPPAGDALTDAQPDTPISRWLIYGSLAGLLACLTYWRLTYWKLTDFRAARARKAAARRQSERYAFAALNRADDAKSAYAAAVAWLERLDSDLDLRRFAIEYGEDALQTEVAALTRALFGSSDGAPDHRRFVRALGKARSRFLKQAQTTSFSDLGPLNPVSG